MTPHNRPRLFGPRSIWLLHGSYMQPVSLGSQMSKHRLQTTSHQLHPSAGALLYYAQEATESGLVEPVASW